jgi:hypothetical protein
MATKDRKPVTPDEAIQYLRNNCAIATNERLETLLGQYTDDLEQLISQKLFTEMCWKIVREEQMRREMYGDY